MWMPDKSKLLVKNDAALIDRDYEDLLFYKYPILFSGINNLSDRIIGSFVENKNGIESYLHAVVDAKTYSDFVNQRISYPQTLQQAYNIYLIHWSGEESPDVYWLNYGEIPENYKPKDLAYCPEISAPPSFDYEAQFEGGPADRHRAKPETVSTFQNKVADLLRIPLGLRGLSNIDSRVLLQAAPSDYLQATGSLKIKYHVELVEKQPTFFHDANAYSQFLNDYLAYCLNKLAEDAPKLVEDDSGGLENFERLVRDYEALVGQSKDSQEQRRKDLKDSVIKSAKKLDDITTIVTDEFKQVVLSSLTETGAFPLGVLDENFGQEIETAIREVEDKAGKKTVIDEELQTYSIHIYDLNTDTRKGKALMPDPNDEKHVMKFRFKISGEDALAETRYTESMYRDKFIDVKGRATKTDGIVKSIEIEFEP
jgi:hypothetical protein